MRKTTEFPVGVIDRAVEYCELYGKKTPLPDYRHDNKMGG